MSDTRRGREVFRGGLLCALPLLLTPTLPAAAFELKDLIKPLTGAKGPLKALAGPSIDVTIEHPPEIELKLNAVALAEPQGQCSEPLAARIEQDFVQAGVTVIDRQRLSEVLAEHKLQLGGAIDEKTAAKVGKLLGAQALIFLTVQQCNATNSRRELYTDKDTHRPVYSHTTTANISGSLRVIDLTTGRVMASQRFEGIEEASDQEAYPDRTVALAVAEKAAASSVQRKLLPWSEVKSLAFYNDGQCDLKLAHRSVKAQNFDDALRLSQANLETCQKKTDIKPAILARAHYNLGMMHFFFKDYDAALASLSEANQVEGSKAFLDAMDDCRRAQGYSVALARYRGEAVAETAVPKNAASKNEAPQLPAFNATPRTGPAASAPSIEERLSRLDDLLKKKVISSSEHEQRRQKILNEI